MTFSSILITRQVNNVNLTIDTGKVFSWAYNLFSRQTLSAFLFPATRTGVMDCVAQHEPPKHYRVPTISNVVQL